MWSKTPDGSVLDKNGKIIFFSAERFVRDVCLGDCCFICGASPDAATFNEEHILPDWLLKEHGLHHRTVTLPNAARKRYGGYTIQCCQDCNSLMGKTVEGPVSEVMKQGLNATNDFVTDGGALKVIVWLGLIFFKTHLNDKKMRHHLDARKGAQSIAQEANYDWSELHHLHSLIRCFYTGAIVTPKAVGSFMTLPIRREAMEEDFDFLDFKVPQTIYLRLGEMGMFAVFNDSCGALKCFMPILDRISGKTVSDLQAREIAAELAALNLHIDERPKFFSKYDRKNEWIRIEACLPERLKLAPINLGVFGEIKESAFRDILLKLKLDGVEAHEARDLARAGRLTFLFDDDGKFIEDGRVVI